jgi:hypothetical protein
MNLLKYSPPVRRTGHPSLAFVTIARLPLSQSHPFIVSQPANPERAVSDWQRVGVAFRSSFWEALAIAAESPLPLRLSGLDVPTPPAGLTWRDFLGELEASIRRRQ